MGAQVIPLHPDETLAYPGLEALYDTYLSVKTRYTEKGASDRFHPSQAAICMRSAFLQRAQVPKTSPPDAAAWRSFEHGKILHRDFQAVLDLAGVLYRPSDYEEYHLVDDDLGWSGYVDAIVGGEPRTIINERDLTSPLRVHTDLTDREWLGLISELRAEFMEKHPGLFDRGYEAWEFKTTKSFYYFSKAQQEYVKSDPATHWFTQAAFCAVLAERNPDQLPVKPARWCVVPMSRAAWGAERYRVTRADIVGAEARMKEMSDLWEAGITANIPCECEGWKVRFCPYKQGKNCCGRGIA